MQGERSRKSAWWTEIYPSTQDTAYECKKVTVVGKDYHDFASRVCIIP